MAAAFEFLKYQIAKLHYDNSQLVEQSQMPQNVQIEAKLERQNEDPANYRLTLDIHVIGSPEVALTILGYFKWNGEYVQNETEYCLHTSGASILFPYARAAISIASSLDGGAPILLQTINFYDLIGNSQPSDEAPGFDAASENHDQEEENT